MIIPIQRIYSPQEISIISKLSVLLKFFLALISWSSVVPDPFTGNWMLCTIAHTLSLCYMIQLTQMVIGFDQFELIDANPIEAPHDASMLGVYCPPYTGSHLIDHNQSPMDLKNMSFHLL